MTVDAHTPRATRRRLVLRLAAACWAAALFATAATPARAAGRPIEVENIWIGLGPNNSFKVGTWTPVWIQLHAGDARFQGFIEVMVADDDGTPTSYYTRVDVAAKDTGTVTAYVRPGSRNPDLTIQLYNDARKLVATVPQELILPRPPEVLMPHETLILSMGQPRGLESVTDLPGFRSGNQPATGLTGLEESLVITRMDPRLGRLPGRWYGYDITRTIVLDTADPEVLKSLEGMRGQPLVEWVRRGGHLVLSVGANWQQLRDSVLAPILPGLPAGQEALPSLEGLDAFAGSSKQITPPSVDPRKVMVTKIEEVKPRGGKALAVMSGLPLVVRGPCGFGRVTLIGVDTSQRLFSDWPDRGLFWARAIDLRTQRADASSVTVPMGGGRFNRMGISDLATLLRASLEQFPGVRLVPFGWVAFFIFLYILLIGPGDYFFLKKILKRMELTWITFPTIVVAVSLIAYYAAYVFKGSELLINQVEVVDVDQVDGIGRGMTWASLFSPQNRDYTMRILPLPIDQRSASAEPGSAGAGERPAPGTEVITSWFSSPENQFASAGSTAPRFRFGSSGYSYGGYSDEGGVNPAGGAIEMLHNVRIPIWSTKNITAQWYGPAKPILDANLHEVGTGRLSGKVTNRLDIPLEDAILAFDRHVYLLGRIEPSATVSVELASNRNLSGLLRERARGYSNPMAYYERANINYKPELLLDAMFHQSLSLMPEERVQTNDVLRDLDLTGQLTLGRPMLVARVRRPGSRLVLDNAPSAPKIDQTTLVRVILPLAGPGE